MSIGPQKSRPSAHPLVSSRSAPELSSAASAQEERVAPAARRTPSPETPPRRVRQLHPAVSGQDASPDAKQDTKQDTKQAPQLPTTVPARVLGNTRRGLVRFVGTFRLEPHTVFEAETDGFTALSESVQRSVQQQPDTAAASSGEATPGEPDSTQ